MSRVYVCSFCGEHVKEKDTILGSHSDAVICSLCLETAINEMINRDNPVIVNLLAEVKQ